MDWNEARRSLPKWRLFIGLLALLLIAFAAKAVRDTMATPAIRTIALEMTVPEGPGRPERIVFLSDIHVAGPDMPPSRFSKIVAQINALDPDLVLIAGDFVSDKNTATRHYSVKDALAPLADLAPRAIKLAVPGNHDHWRDIDAIEAELKRHRIGLLQNEVSNAGGLVIAGLDDDFTGQADLAAVRKVADRFKRPALYLSHSPDPFADLPADAGIMLAGHTHCGQIRYPWGGSPASMSKYGDRYACGVIRENGNTLITTAGVGTSVLPFRLFSQPEIWLITIRPPNP